MHYSQNEYISTLVAGEQPSLDNKTNRNKIQIAPMTAQIETTTTNRPKIKSAEPLGHTKHQKIKSADLMAYNKNQKKVTDPIFLQS